MHEFFRPLPLAAVALLGVNDHVLKATWPGCVTGKLSDVAGCFFLPLFLSALLALATRWRLGLRLALGASVTVVLFCAIKLSPAAAAGVADVLTALGRQVGLPPSRIVADATDLAALPFAGLAIWHGSSSGKGGGPRRRPTFAERLALLAATALLLTATSIPATCPPESGLVDGPISLQSETDCGPSGVIVLRVEPRTCRASLEGGTAVGLPDQGNVYWGYDRTIKLHGDAPLGFAVPEGQVPFTACNLTREGPDLLKVDCESWSSEKRGKGPRHEIRRCSGSLRRVLEPARPAPEGPPSS